MTKNSKSNLIIGLCVWVFALVLILVWIPLDTSTGLVEKVRGRTNIGDSLAPTIAAFFLFFGAVLLIISERNSKLQPAIGRTELTFMFRLMSAIIIGILVMRYTGPALVAFVNVFGGEPLEYRLLRTTPGWKHVGFIFGGIIMVTGVISVVERKFTTRAVMTGICAVIVLLLVFDLPFEDLQLPPNGDV